MRKLLLLCLIIMAGCTQSKQQKAEKLINGYLDTTLNDPHSYESVSFSKLYKLKDTVSEYKGKIDSVNYHGAYQILHTYRGKNSFGAIITKSEWFQLDSSMTEISCCFTKPYNTY